MLIECASTRLNIDLLYSLKKNGYVSSQIRQSYIYNNGLIKFKTFDNLEQLESFYLSEYKYIITARKDPFTIDKSKASYGKIAEKGQILTQELATINTNKIKGLCEVGPFVGIESFKLINSTLGFELIFNCKDISDVFSIIPGRSSRSLKEYEISNMEKYKKLISAFINDYQIIQKELYKSWNANLYTDLCYVNIGYAEDSLKLYKLFFALVKAKINSGLHLDVLQPRFLRKIN